MPRRFAALAVILIAVGIGDAAEPIESTAAAGTTLHPGSSDIGVEIASGPASVTWKTRQQLLGDMGGLRTTLARHGVTFEISSLDEGFANPGGGRDTIEAGRYHGLTDVVLSIDTEGAGWWRGGFVVIDLQNTRGGDISDVVGDLQGVSNIVAPPGTRFAEYFLEQELAGGRIGFKIGKQDANADFVVSVGGGEFINSSFGLIPTVPLPTFPAPSLGVAGSWSPSLRVLIRAGYWDGSPGVGSGVSAAIIDGSRGTVAAVGLEVHPFGGDIPDGSYRLGVWRHTAVDVACPTTKAGALVCPKTKDHAVAVAGSAEGLYFTADQDLWELADRRLAVFAQGGWGEADRSAVSRYFGGGLILDGPLRSRPGSLIGLGFAHAEIGGVERGHSEHHSETVVELFCRFPVTAWMTLNPDLQWVHRPGGSDRSTFVAGLRVGTVF